jgi:putative transposase
MTNLLLPSERQMARIKAHLPLAHGVPRVDGCRVVSGKVYLIRNGLRWKDAPWAHGPHGTLYSCFIRWSRRGVFDRIFAALAGAGPRPERIMIEATYLKAPRTAASLLKNGLFPAVSGARRADERSQARAPHSSRHAARRRPDRRPGWGR